MTIRRIDQTDVHQITSGQVIVDLTTAVKEIVENGLDAGASQIDVTFKDYGKSSIVVTDNGSGIEEQDFANICLKHYTSKLCDFSDVESVSTFGFRGEAMSSLCAIAHVNITTATTKTAPQAWSIEYDSMGSISSKKMTSRPKGTTVEVSNLFERLPVRRIDLVKNIKREYHRAVSFLQCYALVSTGVRMIVRHIDSRGRKSIVLSTSGTKELKQNINSVFGSNSARGLESVDFTVSVPAKFHQGEEDIDFSGFISNASFGQGRSSPDRQFWYINGRPVHLPRFSKAVNETYKKFNHLQYPTVVLVLSMDQKFVDVNVTPDKRTVMLSNEAKILDSLRSKLSDIFGANDVRIPVNDNATGRIAERNNPIKQFTLESFSLKSDQGSQSPSDDETSEDESVKPEVKEVKSLSSFKHDEVIKNEPKTSRFGKSDEMEPDESTADLQKETEMRKYATFSARDPEEGLDMKSNEMQSKAGVMSDEVSISDRKSDELSKAGLNNDEMSKASPNDDEVTKPDLQGERREQSTLKSKSPICPPAAEVTNHECVPKLRLASPPVKELNIARNSFQEATQRRIDKINFGTFGKETTVETKKLDMELGFLKRMHLVEQELVRKEQRLDDITDVNNAEKLLTLTVTKSDFMEMKIVGQFNLGFILVTRKNKNTGCVDLFIVDQHASDEKYNFERLQRDTKFQSQPLVVPQRLELNAIDEMIVSNNVNIFEKNGFKIRVREDENTGQKVELLALPFSKNTQFDLMDFYELINMVREDEGNISLRPSKVRNMFAMRACRSSIMIGRALKKSTMTKVIRHLSGLDKPWNCPHGRPTMRHLVELQGWGTFKEDCH